MNIFKIANSYLVLKGKSVLPSEKERALKLTFECYEAVNGATYQSFDAEQSFVLGAELPLSEYKYAPKEYRNELKDKKTQQEAINKNPGYTFIYADFTVNDKDVPEGFKNIGGKIHNECIVYKMKYDESSQSFILTDERERPCSRYKNHAESDKDSITMYLNMYAFEKQDYLRLQAIHKALNNKRITQAALAPRDRALITAYEETVKRVQKEQKQKKFTFRHEMTHIRNRICNNSFNLALNRGKLSPENRFRLAQYDEKSAHLAENLEAVRQYLNNGNLNDFSVFPEKSQWLVDKLQSVPVHKRKLLLSNKQMLVEGTFAYWDQTHLKGYLFQFENIVRKWAKKSPVSFMGNDDKEYLKRRARMLTFKMLNPLTMKEEQIDFSVFIQKDIPITPQVQKQVINPAEEIIQKRKDKLNKYGITKKMVHYVQQCHWRNNLTPFHNGGNDGR